MPKEPEESHSPSSRQAPEPEALTVEDSGAVHTGVVDTNAQRVRIGDRLRRVTYRPSHRATFVGLAVVGVIIAANIFAVMYFIKSGDSARAESVKDGVTLSADTLNSLGVNKNPVSNQGTELTIGPMTKFNNKVSVGGDMSIAGQLQLNNKLMTSEASISKLEAGAVTINQLTINNDAIAGNLSLQKDLAVAGSTKLQGAVTMNQMLTVNGNTAVSGNLAVGGTLSARNFQASSLVSETSLVIGGHLITRGNAPAASAGGAVGSNGTVSISGNDASGSVAVNIGVGAASGVLATVEFQNAYSVTPHIVVTPIGAPVPGVYVNRTTTGFTINTSPGLSPGGYMFDYIVVQ